MSLEAGIKTHLLSKTLITDLIGQRLYPVKNPQSNETFPAVVWQRTKSDRQRGTTTHSPTFGEFLFVIYSETYDEGISIGAAIRNVLQGFRGTLNSYTVQNVWILDEHDDYFRDASGSDLGFYQRIVPVRFQYIEPTPTLP